MSRNSDIDVALRQGVVDCAIGLPMALDNVAFDDKPSDGSPWCALHVAPSDGGVHAATLGDAGDDEHVGIIQIDLNYPLRQGTAAVTAKADQVAAFFTAGKKLTHGSAKVTVLSCSRSRGREVEGYYRVSMTISWNARVPRN